MNRNSSTQLSASRQVAVRRLAAAPIILVAAVAIVGAGMAWTFNRALPLPAKANAAASVKLADKPPALELPPPDLLRPLTPDEAIAENAERAFARRPDTAASEFKLATDDASRQRAIECLTRAVYYEAAGEGVDGGRAVAQVVLNRMRHPAYPSSVCGVVYQGSERTTGCQFTFTCDGSLARVPAPNLWKQAQRIAIEALAGKVYAPVGHATHYHADYVLPYWADSLDKSLKTGRHIFYRLKGSLGSDKAFQQRYAGQEMPPPSPTMTAVALEAVEQAEELARLAKELGVQAPTGELIAVAENRPQLAADLQQGTLIIDGGNPAPARRKQSQSDSCADSGGGNQLRPLAANNVRSQAKQPAC